MHLFYYVFFAPDVKEQIQNLVTRFAMDPTPISRILVSMSHGNRSGLKDVNGFDYDYNTIILDPFTSKNASHLTNIMKLVLIQACR